jgi:hypothetical protein
MCGRGGNRRGQCRIQLSKGLGTLVNADAVLVAVAAI